MRRSGFSGFVTSFDVATGYLERFKVEVVGSRDHRELWVPAEELEEFNSHIEGPIKVIDHFLGGRFQGAVDPATNLPVEFGDSKAT